MKKKVLTVVLAMAMATSLLAGCGSSADSTTDTAAAADTADAQDSETETTDKGADPSDYKVVMVVKQSDSWFDDMATGIEQLKKDTGLNVSVQVPETGDAASQISIMEDLIAQDVDAICVVPNDPNALVPTIEKAKEAGIVVVTHEAPGIADSVDLDVEAFVNETDKVRCGKCRGRRRRFSGLATVFPRILLARIHRIARAHSAEQANNSWGAKYL